MILGDKIWLERIRFETSGKGQWLASKIWESWAQAESSAGGQVSRVAWSGGCSVGAVVPWTMDRGTQCPLGALPIPRISFDIEVS